MNEIPEEYEQPRIRRNYYGQALENVTGLKYRLDGRDVIRDISNRMRGMYEDEQGKLKEDPELRLMNEKGVSRVQLYLSGAVNKNTHLTKFTNREEIKRQMQGYAISWALLVCKNMKRWRPPGKPKVQSYALAVEVPEQCCYSSLSRGEEGFEAKNITADHQVTELIDQRRQQPQNQNWLSRLNPFSRGGQ